MNATVGSAASWPATTDELIDVQTRLGALDPPPAELGDAVAGCFVCFGGTGAGPGRRGDPGWAAAALSRGSRLSFALVEGEAGAAYQAGLLALREGPLLERAVQALPRAPDLLIVNGTGRDHPRSCGLAFHLGVVLGIPTVGVTHRPLLARGSWPSPERGSTSSLQMEGRLVGYWLRTRPGTRPLAVHSAWQTSAEQAVEIVLGVSRRFRTPEPIRQARRVARQGRSRGTV